MLSTPNLASSVLLTIQYQYNSTTQYIVQRRLRLGLVDTGAMSVLGFGLVLYALATVRYFENYSMRTSFGPSSSMMIKKD